MSTPVYDRRKSDKSLRRRTIFLSVIAAGVVSLFFGYANDHDACERIQDDRRSAATYLEQRADPILGNPKLKIPPADFENPPFSTFRDFRGLIVGNALKDRARAQQIRRRIANENCGLISAL